MPGISLMGAALMQLKYEITIVTNRMVITLLTCWNWRQQKGIDKRDGGSEERGGRKRKHNVKQPFTFTILQ